MRSTISSLAMDRAVRACFNFSFSRNIMKWEGGGGGSVFGLHGEFLGDQVHSVCCWSREGRGGRLKNAILNTKKNLLCASDGGTLKLIFNVTLQCACSLFVYVKK